MVQIKPGQSIYEAIGVDKTADAAEIRKAYLKLAVQLHPDKNPNDTKAKERFQTLQKIYAVLSDTEKRKVYDRTGSLEDTEELSGEQFDSFYNYYRSMYAPITEDDIENFGAVFRGSHEERCQILEYYEKYKGNMDKVFEWVILSDPDQDSHRFMDIIKEYIRDGTVKEHEAFTSWAAKIEKRPRRSVAALNQQSKAKASKRKKTSTVSKEDEEGALVALIADKKRKGNAFSSFLSNLSTKYGVSNGKVRPEEEPTDEEFENARKRLESKRTGSRRNT